MLLNKKEKNFSENKKKMNLKNNIREKNQLKINNEIKANKIRLILDNGDQLGITTLKEGIFKAESKGLDLVEISSNSKPPVCKIMDFGKYKYEQKRKASEIKKKQINIEIKEIKIRPKIDKNDFNIKLNKIKQFLNEGNKCKITIIFKGREIIHTDIGKNILLKIIEILGANIIVEMNPKIEGKQMTILLASRKTNREKNVEEKKN